MLLDNKTSVGAFMTLLNQTCSTMSSIILNALFMAARQEKMAALKYREMQRAAQP